MPARAASAGPCASTILKPALPPARGAATGVFITARVIAALWSAAGASRAVRSTAGKAAALRGSACRCGKSQGVSRGNPASLLCPLLHGSRQARRNRCCCFLREMKHGPGGVTIDGGNDRPRKAALVKENRRMNRRTEVRNARRCGVCSGRMLALPLLRRAFQA